MLVTSITLDDTNLTVLCSGHTSKKLAKVVFTLTAAPSKSRESSFSSTQVPAIDNVSLLVKEALDLPYTPTVFTLYAKPRSL